MVGALGTEMAGSRFVAFWTSPSFLALTHTSGPAPAGAPPPVAWAARIPWQAIHRLAGGPCPLGAGTVVYNVHIGRGVRRGVGGEGSFGTYLWGFRD